MLRSEAAADLEAELKLSRSSRPITLLLPSLYSELEGEALWRIVEELKAVPYLSRVVVTLGGAGREQFLRAKEYFSVLPQPVTVVWNEGPGVGAVLERLRRGGVAVGRAGKGRSVWTALGYIAASGGTSVVALHDCDIVTYERALLARLCYPVASADMGYRYCKGYYARVSDRMYGRLTRLFVTPLLRALRGVYGHLPLLVYLDGFRYPLAGEFSADLSLLRRIGFRADWGLEVGVLVEVFRMSSRQDVCQAEICTLYEHKHQPLGTGDPSVGLLRMCIDVAEALLGALDEEGIELASSRLERVQAAYADEAAVMVEAYRRDALYNGLPYDEEAERKAVDTFSAGLRAAVENHVSGEVKSTLLPPWEWVTAEFPGVERMLVEAVEEDNAP